jgi:archaemetzincin
MGHDQVMMRIRILPLGSVDKDILAIIAEGLSGRLPCRARVGKEVRLPEESFNRRRGQYDSTELLGRIKALKTGEQELILGVTDADLYVPGLNFVFGEADVTTGVVVISLTRLRQEFYGRRADRRLFGQRAVKEAVHELGHACGLDHCADPGCIMYFSNSIRDTDSKGPDFCVICKERLGI